MIDTETNRKLLHEQLSKYRTEIEEFEATLPENEETDTLIKGYEDAYIEGQKLETILQKKSNKLRQIQIAQQETREKEMLQMEKENERQMILEEKEKDRELEKLKLEQEERIALEKLNIEKLRLERQVRSSETRKTSTSENTVNQGNIKLPKLELIKFDGNIFRWQEFWDSYEATIHNNNSLGNIDKFNYLRAQLRNDAKEAITGLETTDANYQVAIDILKERYGKKQLIINAHYSKLKEMPVSPTYYEKLQSTYDNIEKHLRSLEALGEQVESNLMMSLIQSKFPKHVLARLEEYKNSDEPWTVKNLRKELKKYITAQEIGNKLTNLQNENSLKSNEQRNQRNQRNGSHQPTVAFPNNEKRKICIYCKKTHWSDECKEFADVQSRKQQIRGHCYICLKEDHLLKNCTSTKICVYCKKEKNHHRSLCPNQFPTNPTRNNNGSTQTSLVAMGEQVIMQTAMAEACNTTEELSSKIRLLLDCGSQRSYITQYLARKLKLKEIGMNHLSIYTFGTTKAKNIETPVVEVGLMLKSGFTLSIQANVVPEVTGKIERHPILDETIKKKLISFELADEIPKSIQMSKIELLIGNDYYTDIVSMKRLEVTDTLHLLGSKLGWVLTGRTKLNDSINKDIMMLTNATKIASKIS